MKKFPLYKGPASNGYNIKKYIKNLLKYSTKNETHFYIIGIVKGNTYNIRDVFIYIHTYI